MKTPFVYLVAALLVGFAVVAGSTPSPNAFEGKWVVDKKSPSYKAAPQNLQEQIKQQDGKLIIRSNFAQPLNGVYPLFWVGIMVEELQLAPDGTETINHIGPFLHKSKTTIDGNKMVTDWTANVDPGSVTGNWTRTLSDDGKRMTLEINGKSSDGRVMQATLMFTRK